MFVFNCVVNVMEQLSFPKKDQKKQDFFKNKKAQRNKKQRTELETKDEQRETEATAAMATASTVGSRVEAEENTSATQSTASISHSPSDPSIPNTDNSAHRLGKDLYHPVMCKICNTKVAVYDSDEVYHFFNIVTSY